MSVKHFNVAALSPAHLISPHKIGYQDSVDIIFDELHKTRQSFVKIGWYLKHINEERLYEEENYSNIYELAQDKFNISQPTASRFMNLCVEFSVNHDSPELDEKYIDFSVSQLFEMLPMQQKEKEQITPDMTVKEIRTVKNTNKKKKLEAESVEDDNLPGQMSIEKDFQKYMPDSVEENEDATVLKSVSSEEKYATSHILDTIVDGGYKEVEVAKSEVISPNSTKGCSEAKETKEISTDNEESLRDEIEELADGVKEFFWGWEGQEIPKDELEAAKKNVVKLAILIEKFLNIK